MWGIDNTTPFLPPASFLLIPNLVECVSRQRANKSFAREDRSLAGSLNVSLSTRTFIGPSGYPANGITRDTSLFARARVSPSSTLLLRSFRYTEPFPRYQKTFEPLSFCERRVNAPRRNFLLKHSCELKELSKFVSSTSSDPFRFDSPDLLILLLRNPPSRSRAIFRESSPWSFASENPR